MGLGGQCQALAALPQGKTWYPLYKRLGGPQGWSGWVRKISPPPGFNPQTIQPKVSHYTDCAILAHNDFVLPSLLLKFKKISKMNLILTISVRISTT
jgi:hypothetical protein